MPLTIPVLLRTILLALASSALLTASAQVPVVLMSDGGTQVYCNALFYDSGGPDGPYSNSQNQTITFCPGNPGDSIQISFSEVQLGPGDFINVYGGSAVSGTLLGSSNDTEFEGLLLTSDSPDGCITVWFNSNQSLVGAGWAASVQCNHPCDQPTAYFPPFPESPWFVCPYDTLLIDGSGSYAASGHQLTSYTWSIAGITTVSDEAVVHLPTPIPGQFPISLVVTDEIGCSSTNSSAELVRVATYPDFTGTGIGPSQICKGESTTLTGDVEGTYWNSVPDPIVSGLFLLPDGNGVTYTSTINVSGFPAGTTINGATDILNFCMEIEHSFIGDLVMSVSCPNGQTVEFFDGNLEGIGSVYLGGADDNSTGVPGVGATYCFSPSAVWGTLSAENAAGNHVTAGTPPNDSMTPGTYSTQQPFSNWDGCPLNGGWTVSILDDQGQDDGFIFNMSMEINPALYPDIIEFTPSIGLADCDSSSWTGPFLGGLDAGCDNALLTPDAAGTYAYVYTVKDDFGCTFDTTFQLVVTPSATFDPTATLQGCSNPVQLNANMQQPIPTGTLSYTWTPATGLSNPGSPFPTADPPVDTWYRLEVYPLGHPLCGMVDSVFVEPLTHLDNDSVIVHPLCHGEPGTIGILTTGDGGPWDYIWTNAAGDTIRTVDDAVGDTFSGPGGLYTAYITEVTNGNGCTDSVIAEIIEPPLLEVAFLSPDTIICATGTALLHAEAAGGTPALQFHWDQGLPGYGDQTVMPAATTTYSVSLSDQNGCLSDTLSTTVAVRPDLSFSLPDTLVICPEVDEHVFATNAAGGDGAYQYDWGLGPLPGNGHLVNLTASQDFCVTLSDGCETPPVTDCVHFSVLELPDLILTADTVLGCAPLHVTFTVTDTTGGAMVDWNFGTAANVFAGPVRDFLYTVSGHYDVTANVRWPNGCWHDTTLVDLVYVMPLPSTDFTWSPDPVSVLDPTVDLTALAPNASSYHWDIAGLDTASGPATQYTFPAEVGGSYPVTLFVENALGCADSLTRTVEVNDEFLVFIPTAFSPDGDDMNDLFFVQGDDIDTKAFQLLIFDRWGHEVFGTTDRFAPWDGKKNGTVVKNGVYTWRLKARSAYTQNDYEMQGFVTVVK